MVRPEPGSYLYPTEDMVPPGAPIHPPIAPGDVEVFSLWLFVFNNPELCTDPCDMDDVGETPAQGGIYQLDAMIGRGRRITMDGSVWYGQRADFGAPLTEPIDAELHLAMAPHGALLDPPDDIRQLNGAVGTAAHWWAAVLR